MDLDWLQELFNTHDPIIQPDAAPMGLDDPLADSGGTPLFDDSVLHFDSTAHSFPGSDETGVLVGDPLSDAMHYQAQTQSDTCAIVAQQGILKQFSIDLTETDLREYAYSQGWYQPGGGTPLADVGNILEAAGIDTHRVLDASLQDIESELSAGRKVIVGLDANEVWTPQAGMNPLNWWRAELPDAGHAVWVTGVDREAGVVYMNDSGHYQGQARAVQIADFKNAWEDYGNYYCATNEAPPTL